MVIGCGHGAVKDGGGDLDDWAVGQTRPEVGRVPVLVPLQRPTGLLNSPHPVDPRAAGAGLLLVVVVPRGDQSGAVMERGGERCFLA